MQIFCPEGGGCYVRSARLGCCGYTNTQGQSGYGFERSGRSAVPSEQTYRTAMKTAESLVVKDSASDFHGFARKIGGIRVD
jgi:hypothetical protein